MELAIQADDVRAAAERIRPLARRTPVFTSAGFDAEAGVRAFFKCENFQRGGAFKIRGAANLILSLPGSALARGIVAFSDRKSTRLNSSHPCISYAAFCLKKKKPPCLWPPRPSGDQGLRSTLLPGPLA